MRDEILNILANNKQIFLKVKIVPHAPKTKFIAIMADKSFKIAVSVAPEKGKANQELIRFLGQTLNIKNIKISIISGVGSRTKLLKIVIV